MASVDVLFEGYAADRVAGTVSLIRDGDFVAVVDPGMLPSHGAMLDPLAAFGLSPSDVTDVILSHHHPDHTMSVGLFEDARVHDFWAVYHRDTWTEREAEGAELTARVRLLETPGHTPQDITTLVDTGDGVVALTHLWWDAASVDDPLADDPDQLLIQRERVLETATLIVPGHGASFVPR